jgi:hypothetical protein
MKKIITPLFLGIGICYAQQTLTLKPNAADGKDVYIDSRLNTQNFADHPDFATIAWTNGNDPVTGRSLIEFDLSQLPAGAVISSASLKLHGYNSPGHGSHSSLSGSNESIIMQVTSSWDESTVTWDNQPTVTEVNQVIIPPHATDMQDYTLDVTNMVLDMKENNNYGMMIKLTTELQYRRMIFASSDNDDQTKWPELVLTYSFLGINENSLDNSLSVYPNPASGVIHIGKADQADFEISDQLGQLVLSGKLTDGKIDTGYLSPGVYFINTAKGRTKFTKI